VELSLAELEGDLRPYRLGHHQHTPEIAGVLRQVSGGPGDIKVVFVPHLLGTRRGLLVTCHGQLVEGPRGEIAGRARDAYLHDYAQCPRVHVVAAEEVSLRRPVGTPDAWIGLHTGDDGTFTAVASLDNLMKGAASQALQNLNGMLGFAGGAGLEFLWSAA
jgi:N-acetyl-gamma-glutamyl-phosphate reductase